MKKRIVSVFLAAMMLFALVPSSLAEDGDYFLSYPEIGGSLDLPYTLTDAVPEEAGDHFEVLLENPSEPKFAKIDIYNMYTVGDTFTANIETTESVLGGYTMPNTSVYETIVIKDVHLIAAIREKENGNIIGLESVGRHSDNVKEYAGRKFILPEYFDSAKHELIFFNYTLNFYPDGNFGGGAAKIPSLSVGTPVSAEPMSFIFGDANKDGKVNLSDVSMMLKYAAKWDIVNKDTPVSTRIKADNCWYNMPAISAVLKLIAGWDTESLGIGEYDLARCSCVRYYFE